MGRKKTEAVVRLSVVELIIGEYDYQVFSIMTIEIGETLSASLISIEKNWNTDVYIGDFLFLSAIKHIWKKIGEKLDA